MANFQPRSLKLKKYHGSGLQYYKEQAQKRCKKHQCEIINGYCMDSLLKGGKCEQNS